MTATSRVLIVEDRAPLRRLMARALQEGPFEVDAVGDAEGAVRCLRDGTYALVLTDLKLPDGDGLEVLRVSRRLHPQTPVVVLTGYGSVQSAVEAMKAGAADFLEKPVEVDELRELARTLSSPPTATIGAVLDIPGGVQIVGAHPRLRAALRMLRKVAATGSTVLLLGESGTGKELFARAVHALSPRSSGPFVALNCAAIPAGLMENELFGHERGAFTGASQKQSGRFEQAAGGTLLLDEIGELEPGVQAKVLRVLEERSFQRIGGEREIAADVRLVASTNRDLKRAVQQGTFRADLYYRLDVFPIELPPLRERASDIPALARHLLERSARRAQLGDVTLDEEAAALLVEQEWPGNVRQLANVLERAAILSESGVIRSDDLAAVLAPLAQEEDHEELESVRRALRESDGDKRRAAELLGISYRTLLRRVKLYDLEGFPRYRE